MKNLSLIVILIIAGFGLNAQKSGYKITLEVPQLANEQMLLAYHFGSKQYIKDTFLFDSKGKLSIEGEGHLEHGIYLAVFPKLKNNYFEFLVKEQFFGIILSDTANLKKPSFTKSVENTIFYQDIEKMTSYRSKTQPLETKFKTAKGEEKEKLEVQIKALSAEFIDYRKQLMDQNKELFYTDFLGLMREIEIPEFPKKENGEVDEQKRYDYFVGHYWDFTDFSEEGILRTPLFENKLNDYFDKYVYKTPDSVIHHSDIVLNLAQKNEKVFQQCLVTLVNKYANSKVMGDDAIYVHLVKNYYESGKADWVDSTQLYKMKERRVALEPLLIGKISPDLTLRDTTVKTLYRLHDLPFDYSVVYIWDPECGHCKKATPKLKEFYDKHKDGSLMVYAITTSNIEELQQWKDFIKKHNLDWINVGDLYHQTKFRTFYDVTSTPQVFILDKDKKIIAKKLGVEQIESFMHNYLKSIDDPRYLNFDKEEVAPIDYEDTEDHSGHGH